jgi:cytochrome c-type biogenesis protein
MGLQLLELVRVPLPSLDFGMRQSALAFDGGSRRTTTSRGGRSGGGSLFDENGGLILGTKEVIINDEANEEMNNNNNDEQNNYYTGVLFRMFLLGGTSALVASPCATPVLTSLLAYLASASTTSSSSMAAAAAASSGNVWTGASWMLSYTLGYSTPLLVVGATGGQALVNLRKARETNDGFSSALGQWVNPITGGVLIAFGMNGLLVALLGDPSVSALAPIID